MIQLSDQIACVEREIKMRRRVYPKWVAQRHMKQEEADIEIARMQAVLATLIELRNQREPLGALGAAAEIEGAPV